jgi:ABC-2 type transport system ATP-binding protein
MMTSTRTTAPALQVRELTRSFAGVLAVDRVTFQLDRGEVMVLLGANGAGKSTVLRMIAGRVTPDSGQIALASRDVTRRRSRAASEVGAAIESETAWFPRLTGRENLRLFGAVGGVTGRRLREQAAAELERVDLASVADVPVAGYSSGMRARLAIARARLGDPPLLLLDEPGQALDADSHAELMELLASERSRRAVVMATHDPQEAALVADRAVVLRSGRVDGVHAGPFTAGEVGQLLTGPA